MAESFDENGWCFSAGKRRPLHFAELVRHTRIRIFSIVDENGHKKRFVIGHVMRACDGELPLAPEITLESRLGVGRYDRNEQAAVVDLASDLLIPRISAPKLALVEPHLDAGGSQCHTEPLCGRRVLRGIA